MRTVGLIFASGLWATLVFLFTLDLSFPDDALLERARWELNESTSGEWDFQASKAGLWRWSGLKVDDLTLYHGKKRNLRRKRSSDDGRQETPPTQVAHFDHLKVRADLPALLGGRQAAIFDAGLFGGNIRGAASTSDKTNQLDITAENIDLGQLPLKGDDWSVNLVGTAQLEGAFLINNEDLKKNDGAMNLDINGLAIRGGSVMGQAIPEATFSKASLSVEVNGTKLEIINGEFLSDLVDVELDGDAIMSTSSLSRWRLRVEIQAKPSEDLDRLARIPFGNARDDDGVYHMLCTGTVARPRCREDRNSAKGRTVSSSSRSSRVSGSSRYSSDDDDDNKERGVLGEKSSYRTDPDERRKERMEKVKERRERLKKLREERQNDDDDNYGDDDFGDDFDDDDEYDPTDMRRIIPSPDYDEEENYPDDEEYDDEEYFEDDLAPDLLGEQFVGD